MKKAKTPAIGTDIKKLGSIGNLLEYLACKALNASRTSMKMDRKNQKVYKAIGVNWL
jgi:hypothetical protein